MILPRSKNLLAVWVLGQLLLPLAFGPAANADSAKSKISLTPQEQAVLDVFLRRRPRYQHSDTPGTLATKGPGDFNWADGLTADSYARLVAIHPDLQRRVEAGRQFRVDYITGVIRRVDQ